MISVFDICVIGENNQLTYSCGDKVLLTLPLDKLACQCGYRDGDVFYDNQGPFPLAWINFNPSINR